MKRILDEITRKQLLGYVPFSVNARISYTPEEYKSIPEDLRPVFELRALSQEGHVQMQKNVRDYIAEVDSTKKSILSDNNESIFINCIVGWKNLFDAATGEEIEYKCDKGIYSTFPLWLQLSITQYIKKISGISSVEDGSLK